MQHPRSWHVRITHSLDRRHFWSSFREKTFHSLDLIWRVIRWFWIAVIVALIVGVLGNFLYSDVTTSKMDFTDPRTWTITHFLQANTSWISPIFVLAMLLSIFSAWAHRKHMKEARLEEMTEYILKRVDQLNPKDYMSHYVKQIYVPRVVDTTTKEILHELATNDTSLSQKSLGICIFGRLIQGKTRLAWEAMQAELSNWTFIMWPHDSHNSFDFTSGR